jgi:hypothetical protein
MSTQTAGAVPMPLFYNRVVPLDTRAHGDLKLDRTEPYGFASGTNAVPISMVEFNQVAAHYPIVFAGPEALPLAVVGLRDGQNLFVDERGRWQAGRYVPAYVRTYPFIFLQDGPMGGLYLGMEPDSPLLGTRTGEALFANGKPSRVLKATIEVCTAYRDDLIKTRDFCRALINAKLLEERSATLDFARGGAARIDGFLGIAPAAFAALRDVVFIDWRHKGWLEAVYAHFLSQERWVSLMDIASEKTNVRV